MGSKRRTKSVGEANPGAGRRDQTSVGVRRTKDIARKRVRGDAGGDLSDREGRELGGLRVEYVPLSELERWPRNPKLHSLDAIERSIVRFGFTSPIIVDSKSGRIVAGHGRQEALSRMRESGHEPPRNVRVANGAWLVPVVRGLSFENEHEAEAYIMADNRLVEIGGWDLDAFGQIAASFSMEEMGDLGFDPSFLAKSLAAPPREREVSFRVTDDNETGKRFDLIVSFATKAERKELQKLSEQRGWIAREL